MLLQSVSKRLTRNIIRKRETVKGLSIMDKAKMSWNEQLKTKGYNNSSITKEILKAYDDNEQQQRQAIGYLIKDINENPDKFDNHFRNLYSYV